MSRPFDFRLALSALAVLLAFNTSPASARTASTAALPESTSAGTAASRVTDKADTVVLPLGELHTVPVSGKITRIAVGNGKVVSATTAGNRLLLIAEQIGSTQVMVWSAQGMRSLRVHVVHPDLAGARAMLQEIVEASPGLRLSEVDQRLVVSGLAHKPVIEQLERIADDMPGVLLNVQPEQGSAATQSVLFRLHFIEVKKSLLERIGIQWGSSMNGPSFGVQASARSGNFRNIAPDGQGTNLLDPARAFSGVGGSNGGAFFELATSLASQINLGVSDGDIRILASPELTAKSGGQARLQVGGEVPIPLSGAFGSTSVEFKPYGILFDITPTVDSEGVITAKLATELSQIDPAVSVQGIPGFLTRATSTEVSLRSGDVFALSGLLSGELSNAIDKVPALGNIPILGRLFSSDDYRNQRTELVVLVETEIIERGAGRAQSLKERGLNQLDEFRTLSRQRTFSGGRRPLEGRHGAPEAPRPPASQHHSEREAP